jgi:hypothetical protein
MKLSGQRNNFLNWAICFQKKVKIIPKVIKFLDLKASAKIEKLFFQKILGHSLPHLSPPAQCSYKRVYLFCHPEKLYYISQTFMKINKVGQEIN